MFTSHALADPGGHRQHMPPNRINFFHFRIHFCQKVYASEVGTPPWVGAPPNGKSWIRHCHAITAWCNKGLIALIRCLIIITFLLHLRSHSYCNTLNNLFLSLFYRFQKEVQSIISSVNAR